MLVGQSCSSKKSGSIFPGLDVFSKDKVRKKIDISEQIDEVIDDLEKAETESALDYQVEMERRAKIARAKKIAEAKRKERMAKLAAEKARRELARASAARKKALQKKLAEAEKALKLAMAKKKAEEEAKRLAEERAKQAMIARLRAIEEAKAKKKARELARKQAAEEAKRLAIQRQKEKEEMARLQAELKAKSEEKRRLALQKALEEKRRKQQEERKRAEAELARKKAKEEREKKLAEARRKKAAEEKAKKKEKLLANLMKKESWASSPNINKEIENIAGIKQKPATKEWKVAAAATEVIDEKGNVMGVVSADKLSNTETLITALPQPKESIVPKEKAVVIPSIPGYKPVYKPFYGHTYIVRSGDTLESISRYVYGNKSHVPLIISYNKKFNLKHKIQVGMLLYMPLVKNQVKYMPRFSNHGMGKLQVTIDTTLQRVSNFLFGSVHDWPFLLQANPQIKDPLNIPKGTYIFYPIYK